MVGNPLPATCVELKLSGFNLYVLDSVMQFTYLLPRLEKLYIDLFIDHTKFKTRFFHNFCVYVQGHMPNLKKMNLLFVLNSERSAAVIQTFREIGPNTFLLLPAIIRGNVPRWSYFVVS